MQIDNVVEKLIDGYQDVVFNVGNGAIEMMNQVSQVEPATGLMYGAAGLTALYVIKKVPPIGVVMVIIDKISESYNNSNNNSNYK